MSLETHRIVPSSSDSNSPINETTTGQSPEAKASWFSKLTFGWVTPYIKELRNPDLDFKHLIPSLPSDLSVVTSEKYDQSLANNPSLLVALLKSHRVDLAKASGFALASVFGMVGTPLAFSHFLTVVLAEDNLHYTPTDIGVAVALVGISSLCQSICMHHVFFQALRISLRVRTALPLILFRKLGKLHFTAFDKFPAGNIVNLAATDVNRLSWFFNFIFALILSPLQVVAAIGTLGYLLGTPGLVGSAILAVTLTFGLTLARYQERIKKIATHIADDRIARLTEVLASMKLVKLYGWEEHITKQVMKLRSKEASYLRHALKLDAINQFVVYLAPYLCAGVVVWLLVSRSETLPLSSLLPALSVFATLRFALANLPGGIQALLDARISARRLSDILNAKEFKKPNPIGDRDLLLEAQQLTTQFRENDPGRDGTTTSQPRLAVRGINLRIEKGSFIGITGVVGSGKTSLLLSLAGELPIKSGSLQRTPRCEYVPQVPWILSDTIRSNILMEQPFDEKRYREVLEATALIDDLGTFPSGDQTMIGERGVNLSGGQRQRVALARAAYGKAELVFLDDVLSALDPKVGEAIHRKLLQQFFQDRGCVLVTHRHEYLNGCTKTFEMRDGELIEGLSRNFAADEKLDQLAAKAADTKPTGNVEHAGIIEDEERRFGAVRRETAVAYLKHFMTPAVVALAAILYVGRDVFRIGADGLLALWSKQVITTEHNVLAIYLITGACSVLFLTCRVYLMVSRGLKMSSGYHNRLTKAIFAAPLAFFSANPVGRIVNRFSRDIASLDETVPRTLNDFISCLTGVVLAWSILIYLTPKFVLVLLPALGVYLWAQSVYRPAGRECQRLDSVSRSPILAIIAEAAPGVMVLRDPERYALLVKRMIKATDRNGRAFYNLFSINRWLGLVVETLATTMIIGAFAFFNAGESGLSAALGGIALTFALGVSGDLNWAVRSLSMLEGGLTSAERVERYTATAPEETPRDLARYARYPLPPADWPSAGKIAVNSATFAYRTDLPPALSQLSFSARGGERIGIVGRTGAGKSTLLLALFRGILYREGSLLIDDIDLATIPRSILRKRIGYIPQEPIVFRGTIRENLDPFGESTEGELLAALTRSHLRSYVETLPGVLDFNLTEGGRNFSHGQRQLLCLARVILKRPKVLLLDEPTSAIDPETDALIQATIRSEFKHATIITIAHRIETIADYDRLLVIRQGRKVAEGTPAEIIPMIAATGDVESTSNA